MRLLESLRRLLGQGADLPPPSPSGDGDPDLPAVQVQVSELAARLEAVKKEAQVYGIRASQSRGQARGQ